MGSSAYTFYNNAYKGSLSEKDCSELDYYIDLNNEQGCETSLLHCIYEMNNSDVDDFIQDMETYGEPQRDYPKPLGTLSDYQTVGVAFAFTAGNYINGDSVGLGKTVETAGFYNVFKSYARKEGLNYNCLVLTEKSLVSQFRAEMVKFTGDFFQCLYSAEADEISKFTMLNPTDEPLSYSVVGTHHLLKAPSFLAWLERTRLGAGFPFHTLVVDESSVLGGKSSTQIVKSFKAISKYFKKIIFLNATPFETNLEIFYNQLDLLDTKLLPTKADFQSEFCVMRYNGRYKIPTGKYKNQEVFKNRIKYHYFARTRRDNGAEMRDCKGGVLYTELSDIQKYWLNRTQLHRMVYDCPNYLDPSIEFSMENVPKLRSLYNLLHHEAADEETVLVFTYFKEAQYALSEWLDSQGISNKVLNGDTTNKKKRDEIIRGFKNAEYRVLITNVQKGLNFGSCNFCIFYSFDPNPSRMIQFEGRTTRSFDIIGKNVYILCSKGAEEKTLLNVVKQRTKETTNFTNTDLSVVLSVLLSTTGGDDNDDDFAYWTE